MEREKGAKYASETVYLATHCYDRISTADVCGRLWICATIGGTAGGSVRFTTLPVMYSDGFSSRIPAEFMESDPDGSYSSRIRDLPMSDAPTGEYPIQKTGEAKLQADVAVAAKKKLIEYIPEAFRGVVAKALENVLAAGIIALIAWLATQGIQVEIKKNTEAIVEQNELKKIELDAWGVRREQ